MLETVAIILAAGLSTRMGAQNKLLLPIGGDPMIRHMVMTYGAVASSVLVVTGHERLAIETALAGTDAKTVFNPSFARGQQTSVVCGLRAAPQSAQYLIGLGDQPYLSPRNLRELLHRHATDPRRITVPRTGDQRGNPIVVPDALRRTLLEDVQSPGCRKFTRNNPEQVKFHETDAPGYFTDIDTPQAYAALELATLEALT